MGNLSPLESALAKRIGGWGALLLTRNPKRYFDPEEYPDEVPSSSLPNKPHSSLRLSTFWRLDLQTFRRSDIRILPPVTSHMLLNAPAAARNLEEFRLPTPGALDSWDALGRWGFSQGDAETPRRSVCKREPARETPRCPNTEVHPKERNTQDHPFPRAGRAPQIFPARTSRVPASSRSRTRSC